MEEKYAKNEILAAGIALAILVFSANVVIPAIGAGLLYWGAKISAESALVAAGVGTAMATGGWALSDQAEKISMYTGIAAGVCVIVGVALIASGVGVA